MNSRIAKTIKNVFWALLVIIGVVLYIAGKAHIEIDGRLFILPLLFLGGYLLFLLIAQYEANKENVGRTKEFLDNSNPTLFALYLRSFEEGRFGFLSKVGSGLAALTGAHDTEYDLHYDVEENLSDTLSDRLPLLAIGDKLRSFGAAKLRSSDANWRNLVDELMERAALIVMLPGMSPSTLWEIERLSSNAQHKEKTVFVMPRKTIWTGAWSNKSQARRWQALALKVRAYGVEFPAHMRAGCYFRLLDAPRKIEAVNLEAFTTALKYELQKEHVVTKALLERTWQAAMKSYPLEADQYA